MANTLVHHRQQMKIDVATDLHRVCDNITGKTVANIYDIIKSYVPLYLQVRKNLSRGT